MIVRIWEGKTKNEHSDEYAKIITDRDIPNYKKTAGFIKLTFMKRSDEEFTYFTLLTFWTNKELIKVFTGPNLEKAVSYDDDKQYLIDFPGRVTHHHVFAE